MDYQEFKAKTVDEAITQACLKYGVTSSRLDYQVVEEGRTGFLFGFGSREATILAKVKEEKAQQVEVFTKKEVAVPKTPAKKNVKKTEDADRSGEKKPQTAVNETSAKGAAAQEKSEKDSQKPKKSQGKAEGKEKQAADKAEEGSKKNANADKAPKNDKKSDRTGNKSDRKNDRQGSKNDNKAGKPAKNSQEASEAPVSPAPKADFENKSGRYGGGIVTADEIEKRAAAAAARAKEEENSNSDETFGEDRPPKRERRDRRGRRNDRQGHRNRKYNAGNEANAESANAEKPHKQSQPKPARVVTPKSDEEVAEMKEAARSFLANVFRCMDVNVDITMEYDPVEGCISCIFAGDEMGILIGKRGQTLDSLQYLTSLVVNKGKNDYTRVKLDTEDYRARREDTLENLSRNIAYKVRRTGKSIALEPMNPYERRIIHSSLQGNRFVETYSEGEEPYRHVVVAPKRK